jgi:hypothetical protein
VLAISLMVMLCFGVGFAFLMASGGESQTPGSSDVGAIVAMAIAGTFAVASVLTVVVAAFLTQIVVMERRAFTAAISRNWQLVRGRVVQTWGSVLMLGLIALIVTSSVMISGAEIFIYLTAQSLHLNALWEDVLTNAAWGLASLLVQPLFTVFLTLLYYDRRVRREGFDVTVLENQVRTARPRGGSR